jgi:very-short-patch-repair endonuclease
LSYEEAYASFIRRHIASRTGERRGRLERGHRHAESLFLRNVWWPLRGNFNDLHPEYEVLDWRGRSYFADLAWLPGYVKLIFEIKGFAAHVRDMDRQKYCNELNRETFLYAMGFHVISFAYDDVEQRPDLCITLLRMVLSRYQPVQAPISRALLAEKEIVRLAIQLAQPIRPKDVERHFEIDHKTAVLMLKKLCAKGWLLPVLRGNGERIVRYELARDVLDYFN